MRVLLRFVGSSAIEGVGAGDAREPKACLKGVDVDGSSTALRAAGLATVDLPRREGPVR